MKNDKVISILKSLRQYYNDKNEDGYVGFDDEDNEAIDMAIQALEQQPKMGEWKYVTHYARRYRVCSECNAEKEDDRATGWNFCPCCGTPMNGGGEE